MLGSLGFATPSGGLVALAVLVPVAAFAVTRRRQARGRRLLRLPPPGSDSHLSFAALVAVPLLIGLAAAGPSWSRHGGRRIRTDAQAMFIFDTSRSMAASAHAGARTRMARARAAALELRDQAIPEVPSGIASLTTQLLPHLFPTSDARVFDSTVDAAIGVERPPPPALQFGLPGTSFRPLMELRNAGFFDPSTPHRFAILLTDGESAQYDPAYLAQALTGQAAVSAPGGGFQAGGPSAPSAPEAPIELFIVRIGGPRDRIYNPGGTIEAGYRPDPGAAQIVSTLALQAHGHAFTSVSAAVAGLRKAVESGHESLQGSNVRTVALAPYVVLVAFGPLGLLIWRRNLTSL